MTSRPLVEHPQGAAGSSHRGSVPLGPAAVPPLPSRPHYAAVGLACARPSQEDLISAKTIGIAVAAVGLLIAIVAASADATGLAGSGSEGWGTRQTLGVVAGVVLIAIGGAVAFLRRGAR